MKTRKGVTLIELLLALALISIVITIGFSIFSLGNKTQSIASSESQMQADSRLTTEYINNILRYATKAYTIPKSSFQYSEDSVRDPGINYIGLTKDGHIVIDKPGDGEGDPRKIQYIAKKRDGMEYNIVFNEVYDNAGNPNPNMLKYTIESIRNGRVVNKIESSVELMNSQQIDYLGTESDPAVAIAYSMLDPGSQKFIEVTPDAYIAMVLDTSGSMDWDMDGDRNSEPKRMKILKEKVVFMINRLSDLGFKIHVSIVPFSDNANGPWDFVDISNKTNKENLIEKINNEIKADGATNTGDGIRRGYYQLKNKTNTIIAEGKEYSDFTQHMMVLVDGETNRESREIKRTFFNLFVTDDEYSEGDGDTSNRIAVGNIRVVSRTDNDNKYVIHLGNKLIKKHTYLDNGVTKQIINTFVIGFSNNSKDHRSLKAIGESLNGKEFEHINKDTNVITWEPYIIATNADELDFAFEQFESEVENNLWLITRPKLWP